MALATFKIETEITQEVTQGITNFLTKNASKRVMVKLNSPGGLIAEGISIYKALKSHGDTIVRVEGMAASIASVLMLGGARVEMAPDSYVFVHNPFAMGEIAANAHQLRDMADALDTCKDEIIGIYAQHVKLDKAQLENLMMRETYISAKDSIRYGFAQEIKGEVQIDTLNKHLGTEKIKRLMQINSLQMENTPIVEETKTEPTPETVTDPIGEAITALKTQIESLIAKVTELEGKVTSLGTEETKETAEPVIADLVNRIKALESKPEKKPTQKAFKPQVENSAKDFMSMTPMERAQYIRIRNQK